MDSSLAMRRWLLSIRHLNPADGWYCEVVDAIIGTFETNDWAGKLAIYKFLLDNPRCLWNHKTYANAYYGCRVEQRGRWYDTVQNPDLAPFDSTLPSLHELGLDSLLVDAAMGVHYESAGPQILLDAQLRPNPAINNASVAFEIGREAYVRIEVFDLLGNNLSQAGYAGVFETGRSSVELNLKDLSQGSYFIRISTANNEVRTLKLIKE